jgi:peptide deformylase
MIKPRWYTSKILFRLGGMILMSVLNITSITENLLFSKDIALRKPSRELTLEEINEPWFRILVKDMFETLYSTTGIGLAAPQIGVNIQLAVIDTKRDNKEPIVLINPKYEGITDEKVESMETCLSIQFFSGQVMRYKTVKVTALNIHGEEIELIGDTPIKSFVFQHEIDHLYGNLYVDLAESKEKIIPYSGYSCKMAALALKNLGI